MPARIATGVIPRNGGTDDFAEAASRAAAGLGGAPVDLAVVFAGVAGAQDFEDGSAAVRERLDPRASVGCAAQGVVGGGREIEDGGIAVWAASLPEGEVETFHLEAAMASGSTIAISGFPDLDDADAVILLADPYSFPVEPLLAQVALDHPGLPVIGGLASGGGPGRGALACDDEAPRRGAVGVVLSGVDMRSCVSQGARPIGPEMVITAAEGNVVHELASRPALRRLTDAIEELSIEERMLAARGLLLGVVIDENQPEYERGDFLVRGLLGVEEESGTVTVGEHVRVGQTVRMHVRDARSADEDLRQVLDGQLRDLSGPPAGALLFTCNGRGSQMFDTPDHDASALARALGGAPAAGVFCAGEIGPVGPRSFLHGFTATVAVFPR
jgi:small ligand-binding sensory domain FIST